jgi:serine/threonine protein kinase
MPSGTISHYQILEKLGAGGMGEVYKARDLKLERFVALKFLPPESLQQPGARERFLREARSAAALKHPHIATVFEIAEADGHTFIAMEYVAGHTLQARTRSEPVAIDQALQWCIQIGDALAEAHEHAIVHRDIKSTNIMITPRGKAVILDFGLAKKAPEAIATNTDGETEIVGSSLTNPGSMVGTVEYLAPELLRGEEADARSDIFAYGVVIYETLTGNAPFTGRTPAAKMNAILELDPPPLARYNDNVPAELERIARKALAKDRQRRYQTARDLATDLDNLRQSLEAEAVLQRSGEIEAPRRSQPSLSRSAVSVSRPPAPPPAAAPASPVWSLRTRRGIALAGLLAGLVACLVPPREMRSLAAFDASPKQIDVRSRARLTDRGLSLYGYRSHTHTVSEDQVAKFAAFEQLDDGERVALERWQPRVRYATVIASADREDRWEQRTTRDGHLVAMWHRLRPDHVSAAIDEDSSRALAVGLLTRDFGLDLSKFEALPVAENLVEGRRVREFRWQFREPLPRGTQAQAQVQFSGPDLVDARLGMDLPVPILRAMEQRRSVSTILGWTVVVLVALFALGVAIRQRYFAFPGVRGFAVAAAASLFVLSERIFGIPETLVREGAWQVFLETILFLLLVVPVLAVAMSCLAGFAIAVLRAQRPSLAPGLESIVQARFRKNEWLNAMTIGLPLGGLVVLATNALGLLSRLGVLHWTPTPPVPRVPHFIYEPLQALIVMLYFTGIPVAAAIAAGTLVQRPTRLGGWIWPLGIAALAAAIAGESTHVLQPWWATFLNFALQFAVVIWITLRAGILAGGWMLAGISLLTFATEHWPARIGYLRFEAGLALAVWLGLLVWSVVWMSRSRTPRPA